eukprot:6184839-Pleurochrysis_carterae.AAC.1
MHVRRNTLEKVPLVPAIICHEGVRPARLRAVLRIRPFERERLHARHVERLHVAADCNVAFGGGEERGHAERVASRGEVSAKGGRYERAHPLGIEQRVQARHKSLVPIESGRAAMDRMAKV